MRLKGAGGWIFFAFGGKVSYLAAGSLISNRY